MRLGVDIDEIVSDSVDAVLKDVNYTLNGVTFTKEEISNYFLEEIPKLKQAWVTAEQAKNMFDNFMMSDKVLAVKPIIGAQESLKELFDAGAVIYFITARHDDMKINTLKRLDTHYPNIIKDVIFANHFTHKARSKASICRDLQIDIMIEDNLNYARNVASKGTPVHMLQQPRNAQFDQSYASYGIRKHPNRKEIKQAILPD